MGHTATCRETSKHVQLEQGVAAENLRMLGCYALSMQLRTSHLIVKIVHDCYELVKDEAGLGKRKVALA